MPGSLRRRSVRAAALALGVVVGAEACAGSGGTAAPGSVAANGAGSAASSGIEDSAGATVEAGAGAQAGSGGIAQAGSGGMAQAGGRAQAGATSRAGTGGGGSGGAATNGGGPSSNNGVSALPVPPGRSDRPRPTGSAAHLQILPWAGFKSALTYSFDDSQQSQVDHWPDLRDTHIVATYYVTTGNRSLPGYDTAWREALSLGNELGNHTAHHCYYDLTGCIAGTATSIVDEVDSCTSYLEMTLGARDVWTMAYPFGVPAYAADARSRFFLGRGIMDGIIGWADDTDPFSLPVKAAAGGETAADLNAYIDDVQMQGAWMIFLFHTLRPDPQTDNAYADVQIASITGSIAHAKSLSDVWIGTVASIGSYWHGARTVRAVTPTVAGTKTTWLWKLPPHFPPGQILRVSIDGGTLTQGTKTLVWNGHGYFEIALDAGSLSWSP